MLSKNLTNFNKKIFSYSKKICIFAVLINKIKIYIMSETIELSNLRTRREATLKVFTVIFNDQTEEDLKAEIIKIEEEYLIENDIKVVFDGTDTEVPRNILNDFELGTNQVETDEFKLDKEEDTPYDDSIVSVMVSGGGHSFTVNIDINAKEDDNGGIEVNLKAKGHHERPDDISGAPIANLLIDHLTKSILDAIKSFEKRNQVGNE